LTYWDFIDPSQDNLRAISLRQNIANFEAANPGITVESSVVSYGDMLARLPQAAASGQVPDVVKMFSPMVPQLISAGVYQPLDPYMKDVSTTDWLQPWGATVFDGKKMVIPYEIRTSCLMYNTSIFKKLNIEVPQTWDQVVAAAKVAKAAGYTGFGTGFSKADNASVIVELFDSFLTQVGQPITNDQGKAVFDTAKGEEFFAFMKKLQDQGILDSSVISNQYTQVDDGLQNGTVAMAIVGTHRIVSLQAVNQQLGWAPLPGVDQSTRGAATYGWTMGIGSSSKHQEAAWKFVDYMTSNAAQVLLTKGGEVPTRKSTYEDPSFNSTPVGKTVLAIRAFLEADGIAHTYPKNWLTIGNSLADSLQQMYLQNLSPADTMKVAVDGANQ
jgi:multiple sugar transport system substrate-binding protein